MQKKLYVSIIAVLSIVSYVTNLQASSSRLSQTKEANSANPGQYRNLDNISAINNLETKALNQSERHSSTEQITKINSEIKTLELEKRILELQISKLQRKIKHVKEVGLAPDYDDLLRFLGEPVN